MTKSAYKMKMVMSKAWNIASEGARRFGGSSKEYIAAALKEAWKAIRADVWSDAVSSVMAELKEKKINLVGSYYNQSRAMQGAAHWIGR